MAVCYTPYVHYGCTNGSTTTCNKTPAIVGFTSSATAPGSCTGVVVISAGEYNSYEALSLAMGWDTPAFELAFGGGLLMFAIGLGIGLIVSAVRRARTV